MRRGLLCIALALGAILLWGSWLAWRARSNLVTLDVRNMDVRKVVSKMQWQTWERIIVNNNVSGKVTLNVRKVPLEAVLHIVAMQTSSRWTALYPLYSTGKSVVAFKKAVRGDMAPSQSGWTNLFTAPAWRRGNTGGFANNARTGNNLVSAQIEGKDLGFAALALSRFTQAQVVAEDGADAFINLRLEQVPFTEAVAQVARRAHRKWDLLYTLQPLPQVFTRARMTNMTNLAGPFPMTKPLSADERAAAAATREREFEARLATMTPPEREAAQKQQQLVDELNALPPAERQQRLQEMAAANGGAQESSMLQRMQDRLKNMTPEQRVDRDRARLEKQKRQAQQTQ
ncbi:MAG TPA: hypothetical protein VJ063_09685 [Verrucomicrobiae bacterium]|nr:hypothetical protein [Verrucomicrobiae bacterium]